ncbi:MAG TPA: hypothetical protein VK630_06155 [Reyranella sp.]|nr:hypothetical protein [Reyranella sp.]
MLPKVAKSRRMVRENSGLKPSNSQTETPQAAKVQAVNRMMAANSLVRMRLTQRIPVPGWVDASEGAEIVMQDRHALLNAAPHNDADARV